MLEVGTIENTAVAVGTGNGEEVTDEDKATTQVIGPDTQSLTVKKTLAGNRADSYTGNIFTFAVDVSKVEQTDVFWRELAADQGAVYDAETKTLTVTVTGNGSVTLALPLGEYTVTETDGYSLTYYKGTTANGASGRECDVELGETAAVVEFVNTYQYTSSGGGTTPVTPTEPEEPEDLGDEEVPLSELPDVSDNEEELEDLVEEDVPLAELPATGETLLYHIMAAISAMGLAALAITGRKRKEEEEA